MPINKQQNPDLEELELEDEDYLVLSDEELLLDILEDDEDSSGEAQGDLVETVSEEDSAKELTISEALDLTMAIRSTTQALYVLLYKAHQGKAYSALGYSTWKEYIESEFDFSIQRSYQLLDLAKISEALEAKLPEGASLEITEAQARDIKKYLPRVEEKLEQAVADAPEDFTDFKKLAKDVIEEERAEIKKEKKSQPELPIPIEKSSEDLELEKQAYLEEIADEILDQATGGNYSTGEGDYVTPYNYGEKELPGFKDISKELGLDEEKSLSLGNPETISDETSSLYTFFTMAATIDRLPTAREIAEHIPTEVVDKVIANLEGLKELIEDLKEFYPDREEQEIIDLMS